jgi:hypothetical protein
MSHRPGLNRASFHPSGSLALSVALCVSACASDKTGGTGASVEPSSSSSNQLSTGSHDATSHGASSSSTGHSGTSGASGGSSSIGASGASSSSATTTGPSGSSGASGSSSDSSTDGSTGASSESVSGPSGSSSAETTSGQSGTSSSSSDETSSTPGECTRELLDRILDDYFAALEAGDPSGLPLAANVKFTENAEESELGSTDFWMNAGETKYSQRAIDTTQCSIAAQAVIPEGTMDLPVGIRIKVDSGEMTEIETIVVRPGDYTASFAVDSNPARIIELADEIDWNDEVPEAERASREELSGWIDKYFRAFPNGVCNVTDDCLRLENGGGPAGGGNFSCGAGASCSNSSSGNAFEPRVIVVDEVRDITVGFTIFDFQTDGHLDMHMAKMYGGQVHAVHAILRDTNGQSGWE